MTTQRACAHCGSAPRRWRRPFVILDSGEYMHFLCWLWAGLPA